MAITVWSGNSIGHEGDYGYGPNWSEGSTPSTNDDVMLTGPQSVTHTLAQSGAAVDVWRVDSEFHGTIGSPAEVLALDPNSIEVYNTGGPSFISVASATTANIFGTWVPPKGPPCTGLSIEGAGNLSVNLLKGFFQAGRPNSPLGTLTLLTMGSLGGRDSDAYALIPNGSAATTIKVLSGIADVYVATTTLQVWGGIVNIFGSGTIGTLTVNGGTVYPQGSGTITTLNANGGVVDFTKGPATATVTTMNSNGAVVTIDPNVQTITNSVASQGIVTIA